MTSLEDVRVQNLRALVKQSSLAEIARRSKRASSQLCSMTNRRRPFGERIARGIEEAMGLPQGWFDQPHESEVNQLSIQPTDRKEFSYLPIEGTNLFPITTLTLQGGESIMKNVKIHFDADVFKRNFPNRSAESFSAAIVLDASMSPTLNPMDRVLIDTSKPEFTTAGIYCLDTPAGKVLRRIVSTLDGRHSVSADSSPDDKHLLEEFQDVSIVGRLELVWNARKI